MKNEQVSTLYQSLRGISCGVLLGLLFFLLQFTSRASDYAEFKKISLGTTREQALTILRSKRIVCGSDLLIGEDSKCSFVDPWREYLISFDSRTNLVNAKTFSFRPEPSLLYPFQ